MVSFEYYTTDYGGTKVLSSEFTKYLKKAMNYLEYITFNKDLSSLDLKVEEKVKFVLCEVIDILKDHDLRLNALNSSQLSVLSEGVKSESIKSHSVTFQDVKGSEQSDLLKGVEESIYSTLRLSLIPTGLLSRSL